MTGGAKAIQEAAGKPELYALPGGKSDDGGQAQNLYLAEKERNDLGNGERLLARHGSDLLYVREIGPHIWSGTHWRRLGAEEEWRRRAHQTARSILEEAQAKYKAPAPSYMSESDWKEDARKLMGWSLESGNGGRISAMMREAQQYCSVGPTEMDADPFQLNLQNGTLRLEGACEELHPHRAEDRLAKAMPVHFDPDADAPQFKRFLEEVQPDPAIRAFLQRWCGYNLTGDTREQKLVFFYGEGGNGKSVFVDLMASILSDYASTLGIETLLVGGRKAGGGDATPDLARLPGARFVRASEPQDGARFDEARIKAITGGEPILARQLHHDFFEFTPQFKLTISGNHKPRIRGNDIGIWRRFLLVPWEQNIPPERQNRDLPRLLWEERSGVLNWMLDGCRMWLEGGLAIPDAIRAATDEYRSEGDPIGRFIAECLEPLEGHNEPAREVYNAYSRWARASAEKVWSEKAFAEAMRERGQKKLNTRIRLYADVKLQNVPDADDGGDDDVGYY